MHVLYKTLVAIIPRQRVVSSLLSGVTCTAPIQIVALLRQHQLFARLSKCDSAQSEIEYLGHLISGEGVAADFHKVESMVHWPTPTNIKSLVSWASQATTGDLYKAMVTLLGHCP